MTRIRRVLVTAAASAALAGCGGGSTTGTSTSTGAGPSAKGKVVGHLHSSVVPAGMVDPLRFGYPPSDAVMYPITNAWAVADQRSEVDVYAGAVSPVAGRRHRGDGLFVINRYSFRPLRQTQKHLVVAGAGALRITRAPTGRGVATSVQHDGELEFTGAHGLRGTLHLATDTFTLAGGG